MPRRGFTLVELVVVIGVIAVLVSLALPSIGRTVERSRSVADAARLRENATLVKAYTHDHRGVYPIAHSNAFRAAMEWYSPLISTGSLASISEADPHSTVPGRMMRFYLSVAMVYSPDRMKPGRTQLPDNAEASEVRESDVRFPSLKGEMLRYNSGVPAVDGGTLFCCGPRWISPVSMVDQSVRFGTYLDFPGTEGPIAPVDFIGIPVFTTWHGSEGRDL